MTEATKQIIPVHQMESPFSSGIAFSYMEFKDDYDQIMEDSNEVHRDDYYMFLLVEIASATTTLDFEEIQWQKEVVFYVRPGQVHFVTSVREVKGWFLAIDPILIENEFKRMFENQFSTQQPISFKPDSLKRLYETAHLLDHAVKAKQTEFSNRIILNMANVFIGIIAEQYAASNQINRQPKKSRQSLIAYQFMSLLAKNSSNDEESI
jgi:AraC family transcriptional regulator, transcriptional activator of pobA